MFNLVAISLLERLHGKKLAAIFADETGVTERTWRNRLTKGWSPSQDELEASRDRGAKYFSELLQKAGWPEDEAKEIIARNPSWKAGVGLPTANLIFFNSPKYAEGYEEVLSVAVGFDQLCHAMSDAFRSGEVSQAQESLLEASRWLRGYCPDEVDTSDIDALDKEIQAAADIEHLRKLANKLGDEMLFHVLSCWDVTFCSLYFAGKLEAFPLFELVMPRLAPNIEVEPGTLRFLRNGEPPKAGIFDKSVSRLFDFLAVLIYWKKNRKPPTKLPTVVDMAKWFNESERRIVNWRDETTRFTYRNLSDICYAATGVDKDGNATGMPSPMLVAALLWSPLLVRENGKPKSWHMCFDAYEAWWKRNLARLTDKGLKFGETPLPSCLTYQSEGSRSPELWRSSQSSGRSSQSRDSQ
ncbi:MAG: hypothetical protein ABIK25_07460 [Pseudomonadota bacterium]